MQKILVILGPTASGKSEVAVELAKQFNGEIVSADSRQVYKGLDIGTGKITKKEMQGVPHYLLDVVSLKKQFSVSDYKKLADKAIDKILKKNKLPIICGGTGLYIDALLGKINIPEVPPNPKLRKQLESKPVAELFNILRNLDPERAGNIDAKNPRRLIRAIEIALAGPHSTSPSGRVSRGNTLKYNVLKIGIKIEEKNLKEKINKRIGGWMKKGLVKEVQNLHKGGLSWKRMEEIGLEYRLVALYLQNKITKEKLIDRIQIETWQYAKRQMTWFKRTVRQGGGDKKIIWLPPNISKMKSEVKKFIK
ncbi:MAG TPA: tRNA (adenosine(37)-N6)-dimethylallyltransferase MiaA [Candidatus Paceibacterota bacterium]